MTAAPATPATSATSSSTPTGRPCTCGGRGCVETIASGPNMARWARENGWEAPPEADAKELADAANAGDPVALEAFRRGATAVAAMIASVGAVCDLDLVVIGGGVAKSGALLFDPLREVLAVHAGLDFLHDLTGGARRARRRRRPRRRRGLGQQRTLVAPRACAVAHPTAACRVQTRTLAGQAEVQGERCFG